MGLATLLLAAEATFAVRPYYLRTQTEVTVQPSYAKARDLGIEASDRSARWATFTPWEVGLELTFKGLSVSYSAALPRSDAAMAEKGKSTRTSTEIFYCRDWLALELFDEDLKGFYQMQDANGEYLHPTGGDPYPQRPEMRIQSRGANVMYVNDPDNFTIPGRFADGLPKSSGDSLLVMLDARRHRLSNDGPLADPLQADVVGTDGDLTGVDVDGAAGLVGYGFTLTGAHLFLSAAILMGDETQKVVYHTGDEASAPITKHASLINSLLGAGYDNGGFFFGSYGTFGDTYVVHGDAQVQIHRSYIDTYVGWRF